MTSLNRRQVEEVFQEVLDAPERDRGNLLRERCAGQDHLRREVERLLRAYGATAAFLEQPAILNEGVTLAELVRSAEAPSIPTRVGDYEIVRIVGQGGMGVVYEARQQNPSRTVALKVISPGQASQSMVRRFQREADVLGQLQHPGIACVYEAGTAPVQGDGWAASQPFIAMEFIRGETLTQHCQRKALDLRARLDLIARVADAVQHAHEKGVIHRDLKPSNILVDAAGQPKVLDFGIARLTESDIRGITLQTAQGQIVGTLGYMSPEQVIGDPAGIDARTDLYSLGAIMFELLTGRLPHNVKGLLLPEAVRVIREEEPSRLSSTAGRTRSAGRFDRDVETIVSKALEKEPKRRYSSAAEFAADVRRYLSDQPIVARPASASYRLAKFAKRNRMLVGAVGAVFAALVVGLIAVSIVAQRATVQKRIAIAERERAERQTYRSSLAAAWAAVQNNDGAAASGYLLQAPESLRRWEWRLLQHMADPSIGRLEVAQPGDWMIWHNRERRIATCADADGSGPRVIDLNTPGRSAHWQVKLQPGCHLVPLPDPDMVFEWTADGGVGLRRFSDGEYLWHAPRSGSELGVTLDAAGERFVVTTDLERKVGIFSVRTGELIAEHSAKAYLPVPCFSPDGTLLGAGDRVIDLTKGEVLWTFEGSLQGFSPNSRLAVVISGNAASWRSYLRDARTGKIEREMPTWQNFIWSWPGVVFRDDGQTVFSLENQRLLVARDLATGDVLSSAIIRPAEALMLESGPLTVLSDTGQVGALVDKRGGMRLFDARCIGATFAQPVWRGGEYDAHLSRDGSRMVRCGWGSVAMADTLTGRPLWRRHLGIFQSRSVRLSPSGAVVAADAGQGGVILLTAEEGRIVQRLPALGGAATRIRVVRWADEQRVLAGYDDGSLAMWDLRDAAPAARPLGRLDAAVSSLELDSEAQRVAAAAGSQLKVFDLTLQREVKTLEWPTPIVGLAYGSRDHVLALGVANGADVLNADSLQLLARLRGSSSALTQMGWDLQHDRFWGASQDLKLVLWSWPEVLANAPGPSGVAEVQEVASLTVGPYPVLDVAFLPTGTSVVVACSRQTVTWDLARPTASLAAERTRWARATAVAREALAQRISLDDALVYISEYPRLNPGDQDDAREVARMLGPYAPVLNSESWGIVLRADHPPQVYDVAYRQAKAAASVVPDEWRVLNTLGLAEVRVGRCQDAVATLLKSEAGSVAEGSGEQPSNWAIIALAQIRLGNADEARVAVEKARAILRDRPASQDGSTRELLREAEQILEQPG